MKEDEDIAVFETRPIYNWRPIDDLDESEGEFVFGGS
jgi:hypothetical protein